MAKITYIGGFTGEPVTKEGTLLEEYTNGFDTPAGAWCTFNIEGKCTPARFVRVRWTKTKREGTLNKRHIISIEE